MTQSLKCLECGNSLEPQEICCSHCHTHYPLGVKCLVCLETLKESEAIKYENSKTGLIKYFHRDCYGKFNQINQTYSSSAQTAKLITGEPRDYSRPQVNSDYFSEANLIQASFQQNIAFKKLKSEIIWRRLNKILTVSLFGIFLIALWGYFFYLMLGDLGVIIGAFITILMIIPIVKNV